jgi:hypothetical protein
MGARYDQVEPHVGIVRAPLAANITFSAAGEYGPVGVSLDANGRVVIGTAGQSGFIGVLVKNVPTMPAGLATVASVVNDWMGGRAGDIVDVMTQGQIVDTGLAAGTKIYTSAGGVLSATVNAGFQVGYTVEAGRLVVQLGMA